MYILPAIDILDGRAVRLAKGDYAQVTVYNEDPVEQAKAFEDAGAVWLHMVDLDAAKSGQADNSATVQRILSNTTLNVEVGGGIRSMEDLARLADAGAARMVLGTALVRDPDFAQAAVEEYGDMLAAGIDALAGEAAVSGWMEGTGVSAYDLASTMSGLGYRHLVFTDIARDGMQTGIDAAAYREMAAAFGHPVIASGGVANLGDIGNLVALGSAIEGVIAGRAIYEGTLDLKEAIQLCS